MRSSLYQIMQDERSPQRGLLNVLLRRNQDFLVFQIKTYQNKEKKRYQKFKKDANEEYVYFSPSQLASNVVICMYNALFNANMCDL